jgi:hypothetical protein
MLSKIVMAACPFFVFSNWHIHVHAMCVGGIFVFNDSSAELYTVIVSVCLFCKSIHTERANTEPVKSTGLVQKPR